MIDAKKQAKKLEKDIIQWRRELHQIPETDAELPKTSAYVRQKLEEFGIEYRTFSNMGIAATLYGMKDGPTLAFRADMDALPITEQTGLPFCSVNGNMHACGHDAHTAMLLGAAKILAECKGQLEGNVKFIFQPAEETTGGTRDMIEEGCLDSPKVDRLISLHIGSLFESVGTGQFGIRKGPIMASVDSFAVKVQGKGGHGASPHECIDPIVITCEMIQSIQKIISREIKPTHGAVITVGMMKAGTAVNVIPDQAEFSGTIRTLDPADRAFIEQRMKTLIPQIAEANRATVELTYNSYYPPAVNSAEVTDFFAQCAEKIVGRENVVEIDEPSTGTEDVSYYLEKVPGAFSILGSWKPHDDGVYYPHHNSKFHLDEAVLWLGTAVFVQCAFDFADK
jgi:amidohydrolase